MKKRYRVLGLDCANCAAKIEEGIGKLPGIEKARVSFMTERLTIELAEDTTSETIAQLEEEIQQIIQKIEPDGRLA